MRSLSSAQMDRACGVLLGQACGDALGVPYEFSTPPAAGELAVMSGGGLGDYAPGEWSDDTQMAIGIAQVAATGDDLTNPDALDQIAGYFLRWQREGATDIGNQTSWVLSHARQSTGRDGQRVREAAMAYGGRHPLSAGNGALMRTAVVGISAVHDRGRTALNARSVAELTHADPLAGDSCVLWSEAIRVAVLHKRLDVTSGLDLVPRERREQWRQWIQDAETKPAATFNPNGFTVSALQAAWAAITQTPIPQNDPAVAAYPCLHLQDALHAAVRIGNDTDTVAAIAGGLLGAYWGQSAVPAQWARRVHGWPGLRGRQLVRLAALAVRGGESDFQGWPAAAKLEYGEPGRPAVTHPFDDGVWLGTANTLDHDATAVVALCRLGADEAAELGQAETDHIEVRLLDSDDPAANPNLEFVIADTAALIESLRTEGHRVLVHCVAAQQRTPSLGLAYAVIKGVPADEARRGIATALPHSRRRGRLWDAAGAVASQKKTSR